SIPGRIPRISPAPGLYLSVRKTSHLPSGDQRGLKAPRLSCSCNTACLLPSARFVHRSTEPAAFELKVTDLPSGVHALYWSVFFSSVNLMLGPRSSCFTQMSLTEAMPS